jgi:hypothetical protein
MEPPISGSDTAISRSSPIRWVTFDVGSGSYHFSLTLDGNVIKSSSITPTVKKENVGSGAFR